MCFSASASFASSVLLITTGAYCIKTALSSDKKYLPLSFLPLAFGVQQAFEGGLWLGIGSNTSSVVAIASLGFLFFSHWFWLGWIPFSAFAIEPKRAIRNSLMAFTLIGTLYGALLYLPLLLDSDRLTVSTLNSSIYYQISLVFGDSLPGKAASFLYALIILLPLLISSHKPINFFGGLIALSVTSTYILFSYAFISVWCFFAALLSVYIVHILYKVTSLMSKYSAT
jgi:hypothetical protein